MDPADLKALNETFATIERGINNLNARLAAVMAFTAALPGASRVDEVQLNHLLASLRARPVLDAASTQPADFAREALEELRRMAASLETLSRRKPDFEPVDIMARHAKRAE